MYQPCLRWFAFVVCLLTPAVASAQKLVTAGGPGTSPAVRVFDASGTDQTFLAYPAGFPGGVRVALGDVTGDGVLDIITGAGPGGGPHVRVWNGTDLTEVGGFFAYDPAFPGGVFVAAGDVNGDGKADIITGAGAGGGPHVRIWDGATFTEIGGFFAYDPAFPGGVTVAAGDVNGDGLADIITGAGPSGGPHVRVWNGATLTELGGFFAYDPAFPGGVNVAAGDVNGDGLADIITGAGPGGGPHVRVWNGATFAELGGFFAYDPAFPGGVVVGTVDLDRDGRNELITGPALGSPLIRLWTGTTFALFGEYFAYDPALGGNGVFVGSVASNPSTDDAPRVASTVPANTATGVLVDADLTVTFSEAVTAGVGAFVLECAGGAPIFLTNSGLPATTFTLNPPSPLPQSTACTLRIVRSQIADEDTDDPPDAMTADVTISFTTSACTLITVGPTTVPGGTVNLAYAPVTFFPTGGTPPFTWSITSGTLPMGMNLSAAGVLSGTPTQAGAFPLTITATASGGCAGSVSLTLNIASGPNVAPSFTVGPNQTVLEDAGAQSVANWATAISPGLIPGEAGQVVTFNITGNTNPALFGTPPAVSPTGTLTYTTAANAIGTATITLVLQDNGGTALGGVDTSAPQTFTITVTAVNDAPSFAVGPDQTVLENAGPQTVAGWAVAISPGPTDEAGQTVTFSVTGNTNAALFSAGPAVSPTGTLTYTPAPNANGTATITLALQDNGGTASGGVDTSPGLPFTITVTAVNSAPSFTIGANQTVLEDAGPQAIANWATNISPGGPDEAGQTLQFNVTGNTNPALFNAGPVVSSTGTLIYALAFNSSGTATITLTLSDNGGTANGGVDTSAPQSFTITISNINDAPSFTAGANPSSAEDAGAQTIAGWATAISPGPPNEAGQSVAFIVTNNTNAALFSAAPAVSPAGVLTYTSAPNAFGSATITLVLQDNGGVANGGVDQSAPVMFTITVTPVNDPLTLTVPIIAYATAGNTQLHVAGATRAGLASVADASSILTKSIPTDIDGPQPPAVVAFSGPTPNGTATLNADGSFTYVPTVGFTGTDSFQFQVTDGVTPATGTIQVTVGPRVWYVSNLIDANNTAGGDGRSTDAFDTLTAAETASAANDIIFVFNGDSQTTALGGITLKNGVKLHGEGVGLTVAPFGTIVPAGTQPQLTSAGNTIAVLANTANGDRTGVEIRGLSLASTGGNAIDVTSANTQNLGVRISENTITGATQEGIDINQGSSGAATLAVHDNTITAAGTGLDITRTGGTVTITTFDDNVVSGATGGAGIVVSGPSVTFDATPGGAFDVVSGGTTAIGQSGNGVGAVGLVLSNVSGDLSFVDLNVDADNGAALFVAGTGPIDVGAGTGTRLTAGGADLHATGGPAVSVNVATIDLQLASMSASTATNGLVLTNVNGLFSAPSGSAITKSSGTGAAVFVDNSAAGTTVLTATYGGTVTNSSSTGRAVTINSADAGSTLTFAGAVTDNAGQGILLTANTGATITFSGGLTLSTGTNTAFTANGGGTIAVTGGSNTVNASGATAIDLAGVTIGAGGFTLQSTSSGGGVRNVKVTSVTGGAITLGTGALSGATGAAFLVGDGSGGATTGGTAAITYGGTITSTGTTRAVDIQDRGAGAGNITVSGAISHTSGNASVIFLDGNAAGTILFSGAGSALNGGTSTAVSLTNNTGATINFTGGNLDIDATSGGGFVATGGGTVNVTGTGNTIATTTGTGLNVTNTTIGASRLLFRSISSSGGSANGIILDTTGSSGGLTVDGDGANTAVGGNASGGTITGKTGTDGSGTTGSGIYLNATNSVILRRMTINGTNQNFGIRGVNVNGFTMEYTTVTGSNGDNAAIDEGSVNFDNLTGAAAITSSVLEGGFEDNLNVVNTSGTLNRLVITGSTFGFNNTVSGNNNILIESQNPGTTLNFTIQSSTIKGARADWINASNNSTSAMDAVIGGSGLGNTFDNLGANAHPGAAAGGNRVVLGSIGTLTFDVNSNSLKGSKGEAIRVRSTAAGATTGTATGHVRNNVIGVQGTANSGSSEGSGIFAFGDGGSDMTIAITGNTVRQHNNHGIRMDFGDEINDGSVFNATVTGNTVSTPGNINTDFNAISLNNGTVGATDNFTSCVDVGGAGALANIVSGGGSGSIPPNNADIRLRQRQSTTVRLPGYGGANNNDAAVVAYLTGRNTLITAAASNTVPTGGGFISGACIVP